MGEEAMEEVTISAIARLYGAFPQKFGIPRQSNIVDNIVSRIVFEPEYRNVDALRGIDDFDYLWLVWRFSANERQGWSPTVRPPRLGGNQRIGVFATRSSFRPNGLALSSVRLVRVERHTENGPVLYVTGADLMDGTPIYDIKPYLPYTDAHPDARSGFAPVAADCLLEVVCEPSLLGRVGEELREPLLDVLAHDPRPSYQHDEEREYGLSFSGYDVKFKVRDDKVLYVVNIF